MLQPYQRWTPPEMIDLWGAPLWTRLARQIWLAVIDVQAKHGSGIPVDQRDAYHRAIPAAVNTQRLREAEGKTQHDIAAHLLLYNEDATNAWAWAARPPAPEMVDSLDWAHHGMTSADIVENAARWQTRQAIHLTINHAVAVLAGLCQHMKADQTKLVMGRTHNLPAQVTTIGRRFAVCTDEYLRPLRELIALEDVLPTRGIRGAVGTNADMLVLYPTITADLDTALQDLTGLQVAECVAQEPPRTWDYEVAALLLRLCAPLASFALTTRLMVGAGLAAESFDSKQIGSTAMPHKRNPRLSERIHGLMHLLRSQVAGLAAICGDTWNEGDVSHSSARRVLLPEVFYTADAILATTVRVLDGFEDDTASRVGELEDNRLAVASGQLVAALVSRGMSRADAYQAVRSASQHDEDWMAVSELAKLTVSGWDKQTIQALLNGSEAKAGQAYEQVQQVVWAAQSILGDYPLHVKRWTPEKVT